MTSQLPGDHGPCARRHGADLHAGAEYAPCPAALRANSIAEQQGYGSVAIGLIAAARPSFAAQRRHHASNRSTHSHRLRSDTCTALLRHAIAHVDQIIVAGKRCMTVPLGGIEPLSSCICSLLLNGVLLRMRSIKRPASRASLQHVPCGPTLHRPARPRLSACLPECTGSWPIALALRQDPACRGRAPSPAACPRR